MKDALNCLIVVLLFVIASKVGAFNFSLPPVLSVALDIAVGLAVIWAVVLFVRDTPKLFGLIVAVMTATGYWFFAR